MKTNENLSKIVSTGTALVLCFALLLFALLMLWDIATPAHANVYNAHAAGGTIHSSPTSGAAGTPITVTGTGITDGTNPVAAGSVTLGYTSSSDCNSGFNSVSGSGGVVVNGNITNGKFTWPTTSAATYHVCASISPSPSGSPFMLTSLDTFTVSSSSSSSASVGVDNSSYKVGDNITVTLSGFPASTNVSLKVESQDGSSSHSLNSVTTDTTGASTTVHAAPSSPTGTVKIVATAGSITATSDTFTIKKKSSSTPAPRPTPVPTSPPTTYFPPAGLASTPTPVPTATDTPTAVPTDTPTAVPSPTVAPVPTPVRAVVNHNTSPFATILGGRLPILLAIGLGTLIALGLLFVVGRLLLRKFLAPAPLTNMPPSGAPPWNLAQDGSLQANNMGNGIPFAQTMSFDSAFGPGNGGFAPDPGYAPQQVPFNAPFGPGNGGFAPDPGYAPQQVPFNAPFGPGNGGFAPGPDDGSFPPGDGGFGPGPGNSQQPVPLGGPYQPGNSGFAPANVPQQEPFPPNNWYPPPN